MGNSFRAATALCVCLLVAGTTLFAQSPALDEAWAALQGTNYHKAEGLFKRAAEENPTSPRPHLGLMYYYMLADRDMNAMNSFRDALKLVKDPYPYIFSQFNTDVIRNFSTTDKNTMIELLESLAEGKADNAGILKLYAIDRLAGYYKASGKLSKANDLYRSMNCITDWAVIGPFDNPSNSGYDKVYPPEEKIDRTAEYTGRNSAPMKWFVPLSQRTDNWIDFDRSAVSTYGVHYAVTYVFSPAKQTVWVRVGTSGSVKMWLNDERILAIEDETNNGGDTYITETQLQNGWNKILMKVTSWDAGRANFLLRITDPKGNKPEGVYAENAEHSYTSKPGAQFRLIPHFAEEYFRAALKENPSHLENNLLLADVLLMNDRGEEGELVLRDALRRSPNNVMILENMMEAYIRNRKRDEVSTTLEKLSKIDSTVPSAISYKFNEALENKNFTVAESLLQTYENLMPNGENWLAMRVRLMSTRNDPKTLEVMTSGYERFPHNYFFVLGKVYSLIERKDAYGAIAIWEEYLEKHYTQDALLQIANLYSNMGRTSLWENYMKKVIELDNDESADLSRMANELYKRERYDDADEYAKRAIQQCPGASRYYNLRGDIARKLGKTNEAIALYKTAIRLAPGDFKTRAQLRELENKKPVYDLFAKMNVDSLLKSAPKAEDYPDDNSVVMLEDNKIFIHPEGAQESEYEFLIRVFNQTGIDAWKETNLGSNVDILKAVTIKANGTEIRADESGGKLVFKQMQEGDFVYMRWRGKYYSGDRFQRHVTQRHIFDGRYPYRFIRTAVLSPSENLFQYKMHNMNVQPVMTKMDDGTMFTWTMENLPTIKSEENMPAMEQIGKNVELSSVESWQFVADWYTDLTYKKWKPTYEIKEKVAEMMGGDPARLGEDEIIRRVYQFITDSIRYSFVSFRQSGYVPQKARDVLITKIGDCKDVATLGMSMLSVCGISSNYVLLDTRTNLRTKRMPSRDFDHVILRINKKSGPLYLDLTAGNFPVGSVPSGDLESFALLIAPGVKDAMYIERSFFAPREMKAAINATLSPDLTMEVQRTVDYTGAIGASYRYSFKSKGQKEREKIITENLSKSYPNIKLQSVTFRNLDTLANTVTMNETFSSPQYATEAGTMKMTKIPWHTQLYPDEAFSYAERVHPIEYSFSYDAASDEVQLRLPEGLAPIELQPERKLSSPLADYTVQYSFANGVLTARRNFTVKKYYIELSEYQAVKEFYNAVVKEDARQILIGTPPPKPAAPAKKGKK